MSCPKCGNAMYAKEEMMICRQCHYQYYRPVNLPSYSELLKELQDIKKESTKIWGATWESDIPFLVNRLTRGRRGTLYFVPDDAGAHNENDA